jgi:hypothetical protein
LSADSFSSASRSIKGMLATQSAIGGGVTR